MVYFSIMKFSSQINNFFFIFFRAIGADEDLAHSSIRFGIGRFTTEQEIDYTAEKCIKEVQRLREMSPLWYVFYFHEFFSCLKKYFIFITIEYCFFFREMFEEGIDIKSIQWSQH